ncbi:lipocalin-like domain-containing protein [Myroides sp. LJL119]
MKTNKIKSYLPLVLIFLILTLSLTSCHNKNIQGKWVQPISGQQGFQGIELSKGGKASSINMATLKYQTWEKKGDTLIVSGQSIGNGQTSTFYDTLHILELTPGKLTLQKQGLQINYTKQE